MRRQQPPKTDSSQQMYFTVMELANYSRLGKDTIYKAMQNRELKHAAFGRKRVVALKDFEEWFRSRTRMTMKEILMNEDAGNDQGSRAS